MTNNVPARVQGTQFEVVERAVYGNVHRVSEVVEQLSARGLFVSVGRMRYDGSDSYAVVRFRKPLGVSVPGATPAPTTAVAVRRIEPAKRPVARQRWLRPAIAVGALLGALALVAWVINQIVQAASSVNGEAVAGFAVIAVIVAVILRLRGGGGHGHGGGWGFHWTKCD